MGNENQGNKKKAQFNIISGDSTGGDGSYGVGAITLDNVTPVIVDPEANEAYIEMEALHARSKVERRVRFGPSKEGLEDARLYWIVWVVTERGENGPEYTGIGACEIRISREERRIRPGYKSMPEHVNNMDKALKHKMIVDQMDDRSKGLLRDFLKEEKPEIWENTAESVKAAFE
ncbi:MAG TPA: YwhD family protein [Bacillales bacterium]|nr:YwhD family protein [Bacillales bacterium]